ncbi:diadenosine tetraphosphate hydrolase [Lawsonella clevelandensis]|uniref:AP-4-A phosphorylase n=2 Tax=Lawsonella clevelandensis TaxID=1528099 RepID=A0A0M3TBE1_9ACTN|nr:diadenosine tetraphosphate hydrolase [Lawsonella clevelandensis]ALE34127.1 diadenosine tetraphosphate hydrolase [Lawsonella clevelandensis]VHN99639.1 AP-4-A phosphorylase [Lawsonella clevelandensis]
MPKPEYVDSGLGTPDKLERLWAPYRMSYITEEAAPVEEPETSANACTKSRDPFLYLPKCSDEEGLIVARGELCFVCLNLYPYNPGHSMVIPYRQVADYEDLTTAETMELALMTQRLIRVIRAVSQPDAFNIGFNLGNGAGGSVTDHLHQHVVPRWVGDANFITLFADTKVLPQTLQDTRRLLAEEWERQVAASDH